MQSTLTIDARKLSRILLLAFAVLLACQMIIAVAHIAFHRQLAAFTTLFDMDLEANLPVFFNCGLFFLLAVLCHLSSRSEEMATARGWRILTYVLIFLGIDEGSQIHERFMLWSMRLLQGSDPGRDLGLFHYAWVVPYLIAGAVLLAILLHFLMRIPGMTRKGLIISGAVYVTGAVVMEMISGTIAKPLEGEATAMVMARIPCEVYPYGECNLYLSAPYVATYMLEESLEMCGLIMCIHVVVRHMQREGRQFTLVLPKMEG